MVINTHKILSAVIYDQVQKNSDFSLEYKYFLWGNVQPDILPGLAIKSHYKAESLDFVINKIVKLSKMPSTVLINKQIRNNFSRDLGIISHFLCDFFCYPHYMRWHYNSSMMLPHIKFEKGLNLTARSISAIPDLSLHAVGDFESNDLKFFIETVQGEYSLREDYLNDLIYASNICSKIIQSLIRFIFNTEKTQAYAQIA